MNYFLDADKLRAEFDGRVAGYLYTNYPLKKISWFRVGVLLSCCSNQKI